MDVLFLGKDRHLQSASQAKITLVNWLRVFVLVRLCATDFLYPKRLRLTEQDKERSPREVCRLASGLRTALP